MSLDLEETLIALAISATTNPAAQLALEKLKELKGCEVHMTHIPTPGRRGGPAAPRREPDERPELLLEGPLHRLKEKGTWV